MSLILTSPAFRHEGKIPARFTCEGDDLSPELRWSGVPGGVAKAKLESAMDGNILEKAELIGTYEKGNKKGFLGSLFGGR